MFDVDPPPRYPLAAAAWAAADAPPAVAHAALSLPGGDAYAGDALGATPHGVGTFVAANGDRYQGAWRAGQRHGQGVAVFARGASYDGEWVDGHPHGCVERGGRGWKAGKNKENEKTTAAAALSPPPPQPSPSHGRATYENGGFYVGDFRGGVRAGWGRHAFPGGAVHEGGWAADAPHGPGVLACPSTGRFVGTFDQGDRVTGEWVSADGRERYEGAWRGAARHGEGAGTLGPAARYTGAWADDAPHGHGVAVYADGSRYEGGWAAGKREGGGTLTRPDGSFYKGAWAADAEHGTGRALLPSGLRYEGGWAAGRPHGAGRERAPDGGRYAGAFQAGLRCGRGREICADGSTFDGEWVAGARHGRGVAVFSDGARFAGRWVRGAWAQEPACAAKCVITGDGTSRAVAGAPAALTLAAVDPAGQPRLSGGDAVTAWLLDAAGARVDAVVTDAGNGTYGVTYVAAAAGAAALHVECGGAAAADGPYSVYVAAGPPDAAATVVDWPIAPDDDGVVRVRVACADACGNAVPSSSALARVAGELAAAGTRVPLSFAPDGDAAILGTARMPAAACGGAWVDVAVGGARAAGAPRALFAHAAPPPADAAAPIPDEVTRWKRVAAAAYGEEAGWESDGGGDDRENAAAAAATADAHPGVPIVESLTDLWLVSKLTREREGKAAAARVGEGAAE